MLQWSSHAYIYLRLFLHYLTYSFVSKCLPLMARRVIQRKSNSSECFWRSISRHYLPSRQDASIGVGRHTHIPGAAKSAIALVACVLSAWLTSVNVHQHLSRTWRYFRQTFITSFTVSPELPTMKPWSLDKSGTRPTSDTILLTSWENYSDNKSWSGG